MCEPPCRVLEVERDIRAAGLEDRQLVREPGCARRVEGGRIEVELGAARCEPQCQRERRRRAEDREHTRLPDTGIAERRESQAAPLAERGEHGGARVLLPALSER